MKMKELTITDEWYLDGQVYTKTYTEEDILNELDYIQGTEEYQDMDYFSHNRAEHLGELLKEVSK